MFDFSSCGRTRTEYFLYGYSGFGQSLKKKKDVPVQGPVPCLRSTQVSPEVQSASQLTANLPLRKSRHEDSPVSASTRQLHWAPLLWQVELRSAQVFFPAQKGGASLRLRRFLLRLLFLAFLPASASANQDIEVRPPSSTTSARRRVPAKLSALSRVSKRVISTGGSRAQSIR